MALSPRAKRQRHKRHVMADINVTPMVDVMLVLLVIFMVAAPMLTTGVDVNLPEAQTAALPQEVEPPLAVTLRSDGSLYLQNEAVTQEELATKLAAIIPNRQSDKIYVRADDDNSYGAIFELMGFLSSLGYHDIGLVGDVPQTINVTQPDGAAGQ